MRKRCYVDYDIILALLFSIRPLYEGGCLKAARGRSERTIGAAEEMSIENLIPAEE